MKGFSLIELLVVITIVGLLSAIGVSTYKNYTLRVQSEQIIKLMNKLQHESILYYTKNGSWPEDPTNLGYAFDGNGYITAFNDYTPYISNVWVGRNGSSCDLNIGEVEIVLNLDAFNSPTSGTLYMDYAEINGTIVSTCSNNTTINPEDPNYVLIASCVNPLYPDFIAIEAAACNQ